MGDGAGSGVAVATNVAVGGMVGEATAAGVAAATKGVGAVAGPPQAAIANDRIPQTTHRILDMRFSQQGVFGYQYSTLAPGMLVQILTVSLRCMVAGAGR